MKENKLFLNIVKTLIFGYICTGLNYCANPGTGTNTGTSTGTTTGGGTGSGGGACLMSDVLCYNFVGSGYVSSATQTGCTSSGTAIYYASGGCPANNSVNASCNGKCKVHVGLSDEYHVVGYGASWVIDANNCTNAYNGTFDANCP